MAGAKCPLKPPSNFQLSGMLEGLTEAEGPRGPVSHSSLGSSITACKKVLCGDSVLDSAEYWLRNQKALCRLGLLDEHAASCAATICFVNLDQLKLDRHDDSCVKRLTSISPDLPKLIGSLRERQPRENEVMLLSGLEAPDTGHHDPAHAQALRAVDVCVVPCTRAWRPSQPGAVVFDINKFLIGLQWANQERRPQGVGVARQRPDDDTNRSVSSIEDDFLTASEQLGDDSEDDGVKNEAESREAAAVTVGGAGPAGQGACPGERRDSDSSEATVCDPAKSRADGRGGVVRRATKEEESAGHYASNLAESVLQDAFIRLSQDEPSFAPGAALSVSLTGAPPTGPSPTEEPSRAHACAFELPKIVIVQSPDYSEGAPEWPGTPPSSRVLADPASTAREQRGHRGDGHASKPLEVALACAASVVGTIASPQAAEQLTPEPADEDTEHLTPADEDTDEWREDSEEEGGADDYSVPPAVCGVARVAGVVAAGDLLEEEEPSRDSDRSSQLYCASRGLLSAAQTSAAVTLHCSVTEGTSVDAFRASIAQVLHREAAHVLAQPRGYISLAHLMETTHNKIVDGITCPKKLCVDETEVDDFIAEVADGLFKHALEKAKKKKELDAPGKDAPGLQGFVQDSVNGLLFDLLCLTSKKVGDVFKCNVGPWDAQEDEARRRAFEAAAKEPVSQTLQFASFGQPDNSDNKSSRLSMFTGSREDKYGSEEKEREGKHPGSHGSPVLIKEQRRYGQTRVSLVDFGDPQSRGVSREPLGETPSLSPERRGSRFSSDSRQSSLTPQSSLSSCSGALVSLRTDAESRTPVTCFADDLATTVVSMATELAAICLENSSGKQPWFCALKGAAACEEAAASPEAYLLPCRSALRRKEGQNAAAVATVVAATASRKHRPPRLSEIKRKTEEHPELMERLVNRVVDETVNPDDLQDPFALFASEVSARIMNCPELSVVDTSRPGQQQQTSSRSRLQCERWGRGKAASYESIPEEDGADPGAGTPNNTLGPGSRLGQNLSRGSSISKQSSCESITDEFSRFMVNQMETEGRGFDLLLDYYAGKNASSILAAAVQQAAGAKKNGGGHLGVRSASLCLSKQSSTESITEEFYRFMLRDMDKENKDYGMAKTREWSNSLLPPSPRSPFCIRQSSVPDRRSSDSRLTVNSPVKANSFDGFARNVRGGETLNVYPASSVSAAGLCKSDSCLYQRGQMDRITDMLIHETWSSSIESLMRKNKIIVDPEDSLDSDGAGDSQPHVQQYANRLAADIVETGKSLLGGREEGEGGGGATAGRQQHMPVGERRRGFKQSRPGCGRSKAGQEQVGSASPAARATREVPLIHIEGDQRDDPDLATQTDLATRRLEENVLASSSSSREQDRAVGVAMVGVAVGQGSPGASSEESTGSWSHIAPDDDPHDETSSFVQLSEGNGNSSASSLGLTDLEAFPDLLPTQRTLTGEEAGKGQPQSKDNADAGVPVQTLGGGGGQREVLVLNCDLDPEAADAELRVALQWMAASELGLPTLYCRRARERRSNKFQRVVQLASQRSWRIADLFGAVLQFCRLHEEQRGGSLFDWLLENF